MTELVRLDKWLWAARFFKTRAQAAAAVESGKVQWNGCRVKPARHLVPGAMLLIDNGACQWEVAVLALAEQRGPAPVARTLYAETTASVARRQLLAEQRKYQQEPALSLKGRPTKRARRQLDQTRD